MQAKTPGGSEEEEAAEIGDIFPNPAARFEYDGEEILNGAGAFKYSYQVPLESSHYLMMEVRNSRRPEGWPD